MLDPVTALLGGEGPDVVYECRRCGTTVEDDDDECPHCGTESDLVEYQIE